MERDGEASAYAAGQRTGAAYLIGVVVVVAFVLGWTRGFVSPGDDGSAALARPAPPASSRPLDASRCTTATPCRCAGSGSSANQAAEFEPARHAAAMAFDQRWTTLD